MKFTELNISTNEKNLTEKLKVFFDELQAQDVVLLYGPIGAGKTTLVSHYIRYKMELENLSKPHLADPLVHANSPSYNLIHEYNLSRVDVIHVDLYRIADEEDLDSTGFWDVLQKKNSICFIEWPDKININDLTYKRLFKVQILLDSESRSIRVGQHL